MTLLGKLSFILEAVLSILERVMTILDLDIVVAMLLWRGNTCMSFYREVIHVCHSIER